MEDEGGISGMHGDEEELTRTVVQERTKWRMSSGWHSSTAEEGWKS